VSFYSLGSALEEVLKCSEVKYILKRPHKVIHGVRGVIGDLLDCEQVFQGHEMGRDWTIEQQQQRE